MAQPPLSQAIRRLEAELDVTLFERSTRSVALTDAGRLLYDEAGPLLRLADETGRRLSDFRRGDGGTLRIGFVDSASYDVMPRFLRAYRERFPAVDYELRTLSSDDQAAALAAGAIDVGIARTTPSGPGLAGTALLDERLVLAVGPDHRLARRRSVGLPALADEQFIGFDRTASPTLFGELTALFAGHAIDYEPVIEATEYTTVVGLVAAGQGVAVVPACVQTFRPPGVHYLRLNDPAARSTLLLLRREPDTRPLVGHAIRLAVDVFG